MLRNCSLIAALIILFVAFLLCSPYCDQFIAAIPFDPISNSFYGETHLWCRLVYYTVPFITALFIIIPVMLLLFKQRSSDPKKTKRFALIILITMLLGPGLLVNVVFKDHWGRARPYQVMRDHQVFTPVWQANFHAPKNNSFCGGHASIGFFFGVLLLAQGRRKAAILVGALGGMFIGLVRILQGGHYLSDVVFAGIVVWLVAELVVYLFDWYYR